MSYGCTLGRQLHAASIALRVELFLVIPRMLVDHRFTVAAEKLSRVVMGVRSTLVTPRAIEHIGVNTVPIEAHFRSNRQLDYGSAVSTLACPTRF